jgi:hypothetical protein
MGKPLNLTLFGDKGILTNEQTRMLDHVAILHVL